MSDILIQQNNEALVPPEFPTNVREQAPVLIQENILQDGGIAATVDVVSTTTLDPDTPAYVNNIGDEKHAILQFGIPKGETGAAGVDGVDGQAATITVGSTTTLEPDESAAVVNSGTSQNAVLNFSIPQGVQGIQGEQGISPRAYVEQTATGAMIHIDDYMTETNVEVLNGQDGADGQAATVSVGSTTTGAAGTNASVVNSGTTSAAVLDFTIPRGADGAAGRDGTDGVSPTATVSQTSTGATITITDGQGTTTANITNGVDGTDGTDGITPTITATASVDNTTGTPSVSVSKTGSDVNPNFAFAFEHLKGDTGAAGTTDWNGITNKPTVQSVSLTKETQDITWDGNTFCKKLADIVIVNINIATGNAFNGAMYSGLPTPSSTIVFGLNGNNGVAYRATIQTDGKMYTDGNVDGGVWINGQAIYFI